MKKSIYVAPIAAALTILATPAAASDKLLAHAGEDGVVDTARRRSSPAVLRADSSDGP